MVFTTAALFLAVPLEDADDEAYIGFGVICPTV